MTLRRKLNPDDLNCEWRFEDDKSIIAIGKDATRADVEAFIRLNWMKIEAYQEAARGGKPRRKRARHKSEKKEGQHYLLAEMNAWPIEFLQQLAKSRSTRRETLISSFIQQATKGKVRLEDGTIRSIINRQKKKSR